MLNTFKNQNQSKEVSPVDVDVPPVAVAVLPVAVTTSVMLLPPNMVFEEK